MCVLEIRQLFRNDNRKIFQVIFAILLSISLDFSFHRIMPLPDS